MPSISDLLMSRLGEGGLESLAAALGSDPDATRTAAAAALPLLLGALAKNASSEEGATSLAGALDRDHDGSVLDGPAEAIARRDRDEGDRILEHVLGGNRAVAEAGIARASGLNSTQASEMLAKLAPLVMGALGRAKRGRELDAGGVGELLKGEGSQAREQLGGLAGLLDRDGDGSIADDVLGGLGKSLFGR